MALPAPDGTPGARRTRVNPVSGTGSTKTPEPVVSLAGSAPLREPSAKAATHCTDGTSPCTSTKPASASSAKASQDRSKSASRWPVSAFMAAVGRGGLQDAGGGGQDGVLPVRRLRRAAR